MNVERLTKLAAELRSLGAEDPVAFDMWAWARRGIGQECFTAACAFGRAALMWPQELMLVVDESGEGWHICYHRLGRNLWDYYAAEEFFGLSETQTHWLFNPGYYRSESGQPIPVHEVVARIELLVRELAP
jgi:hypothetical protein